MVEAKAMLLTEVDPLRALDAHMQGFRVLPMADAAPLGQVFVTATGSRDVIAREHMEAMRDGAILANAGHFDAEIDVRALADLAVAVTPGVRPHVDVREDGTRRHFSNQRVEAIDSFRLLRRAF